MVKKLVSIRRGDDYFLLPFADIIMSVHHTLLTQVENSVCLSSLCSVRVIKKLI